MENAGKIYENVSVLKLKNLWDPEDTNLFIQHAQRYTHAGLRVYWEAIDRTIKFAELILLKQAKNPEKQRKVNNDKYRWQKSDYSTKLNHRFNKYESDFNNPGANRFYKRGIQEGGRRLPSPPGRRY